MSAGSVSTDRILARLDEYLGKNDYASAEKHLLYWLSEAEKSRNLRATLLVRNELMGLYRKLGNRDGALECAHAALDLIKSAGLDQNVGGATTLLNAATVCKAFERPLESLSLFERAREIYERELLSTDPRLGGLYNNMALTLVDLGRFAEAYDLYQKAIAVMSATENGDLEVAITHLNIASAAEAEKGLEEANEEILARLDMAEALLNEHPKRDGYYAFVCEKCASVFDYYGSFFFAGELTERARRIYEGT